jgi:hypothetical protein
MALAEELGQEEWVNCKLALWPQPDALWAENLLDEHASGTCNSHPFCEF